MDAGETTRPIASFVHFNSLVMYPDQGKGDKGATGRYRWQWWTWDDAVWLTMLLTRALYGHFPCYNRGEREATCF